MIFPPIVLGIEPNASLPSFVLHLNCKLSSDLRTLGVPGILTDSAKHLLFIWHVHWKQIHGDGVISKSVIMPPP
jgi:hypothetical protein